MITEKEVGHAIIAAAIQVRSVVGPALWESLHQACLSYDLDKSHLRVGQQGLISIRYEGVVINNGYRMDLLVATLADVELKAVEAVLRVHDGQLLGYLRPAAQARRFTELRCGAYVRPDPRDGRSPPSPLRPLG